MGLCLCPPALWKPNIYSPFGFVFGLNQLLREMLHYVHQLVTNCVCVLFGADQVVFWGFFWAFAPKTATCGGWKRRYENGVGLKTKSVNWKKEQLSWMIILYGFITTSDIFQLQKVS